MTRRAFIWSLFSPFSPFHQVVTETGHSWFFVGGLGLLGTNQSGSTLGEQHISGVRAASFSLRCPMRVPMDSYVPSLFLLQTFTASSNNLHLFCPISGFGFWGFNFPFSLPIGLTSEMWVRQSSPWAAPALQQPASCPADVQGHLTGDNLELLGKTQGAWQSPIMSLLGRCCSCQAEEDYIQAQRCVFSFGP